MVRRSREQWLALFQEFEQSKLIASEFCRERELCPRYFSKRKKDLGWQSSATIKPKMIKLLKPRIDTTHTIVLNAGNTKLTLSPHTSPVWLARLIKALV